MDPFIEPLIRMAPENHAITIGVAIALIVVALTSIILFCQRRKKIGEPTNLELSNIDYDSVTLEWTRPKEGGRHVTLYTILCRSSDDPTDQWQSKMITSKEKVKITNLTHHTTYLFKVRPECGNWYGKESDVSNEIKTKPKYPGKPSHKPVATRVNQNSVCLTWGEPEFGADQVVRHIVSYRSAVGDQDWWKKVVVEGNFHINVIDKLEPETKYFFKVCPESKFGLGPESDLSDEIKTDKVLSKRIKEISQRVSPDTSSPERYNLKMKKYAKGMRCVLGEPSSNLADEKVLMLVGATGVGKTTLLNSIVNYILGVKLDDDFRFQLDLKTSVSQAQSQTSKVTAYTFYPMDGSRLSYPLTIIDTPGFGDTRGIAFDKLILKQILEIVSIEKEHSIKHFDGVGIVIQAPLAHLTQTQKYIFASILKVFGINVVSNMFLMVTFADGQDPPVLNAVKEANIPYGIFFKFNNSALFAKPDTGGVTQLYWNMGMESFNIFFSDFESIKPVSVLMTREVLKERLHLELLVEGLHEKINSGLDKIDALQIEGKLLKEKEEEMKLNENFTYNVTTTKQKQVNLPQESNQIVLNCRNCFTTCHFPCERKDDDIYNCIVMDCHDPNVARCTICPSSCTWNMHNLQGFHYESVKQVETRTAKTLKARYDKAKGHHEEAKSTIAILEEDLSQMQQDVMIKIKNARKCKERLTEIALEPETLTEADYIDILIEAEKNEKSEGFIKRIEALQELKSAGKLLAQLNKEDNMPPKEFTKDWWTNF